MSVGLVPYLWKSEPGDVPHWALPDGDTSSIQVQTGPQIADPASTGYAIATYAGPLPDGSVELATGNVTRDRDAIESTLGFRPEGETIPEMVRSLLTDGADDAHLDAVRPLRCHIPSQFELHLGGKHTFPTSHTDRLREAVYVRRDLDAFLDDVQAGRLPDGIHRKVLKAEADRLGIDWRTLRSKATRWRNETALAPTTEINDPFNDGAFVLLNTYNGWTTPQGSADFQTGLGRLACQENQGGQNVFKFAWHTTPLSSPNNQADLVDVPPESFSPFGAACRGDGTATAYTADNWSGAHRLFAIVSGSHVSLASTTSTAASLLRLRVQALASTIKTDDAGSSWRQTVTNTTISAGLRVGLYYFPVGQSSSNYRVAQGFYGLDFLPPTVTSNTASGTVGVGGTVQMTASESPTSWSLPGSPPTGVSINSSGLVTWTGATPVAVHSISVRATNALGSGDGTLALTITAAGGVRRKSRPSHRVGV